MTGAVVNNYEPSMVIEGTSKAGREDISPVDMQVRTCIKLLNVVNYRGWRDAFFRAVMVLDTALLMMGKDKEYLEVKKKLMAEYKIEDKVISSITDDYIEYAHKLFMEQLTMINRKKERDITAELEIEESQLAEQEELTVDGATDAE